LATASAIRCISNALLCLAPPCWAPTSHTPTCGGMGVLALGAGGLDVAIAMAGSPYYLRMPRVLGVELLGRLQPGVTAKDIIFEVLRRLTVKGGVGRVLDDWGRGAADRGGRE